MKLTEFFAEIFFKTNPLPLKDLIKNIGELNARTILAGVGLDGIYVKLKQITDQSISTAMSLNIFGKSTNLPIEGAQRFANAVEQLGGNSKDALNDLAQLKMRLLNLKRLGKPDEGLASANYWLKRVGASIPFGVTDPVKVIDRIRSGFQKLSQDEQLLVLQSLGLSESAAIYLRLTEAQWEAQKKNVSMLLEQVNLIADMNKEWIALSQNIKQAGNSLVASFSPELAELGRQMNAIIGSDAFKKIWPYISGQFIYKGVLTGVNALLMSAQNPRDALSGLASGKSIKELMTADYQQIGEAMYKIHDKFSITLPSVSGLTGAGASMTQQNTITIAVNGAESGPAGIAQQIAREIEHVLKKTAYQDGGKRL